MVFVMRVREEMVLVSVPLDGQGPIVILNAKVVPQRPAQATVPVMWGLANVVVSRDMEGRHVIAVSYTHLRAHETPEHLVCRLLLEKKKHDTKDGEVQSRVAFK
eukprot:TRINITY_DN64995_c0_g1_i1.p3 TRINITY_DN64995_c0_g1~~TRINITY_DN64995_c0_g1_i1.p3  ORF type:complete len:104 (-),score=16.67 TRINITY_DN64995_c0_g1_i1:12-323(-)